MGILSTPSIKRSLKFFVTTILLGFLLPGMIYAQATGDFRSRVTTGNWNAFGSWDRYNGSAWVPAVTGETPTSTSAVLIRNGHTITVSTGTGFACGNLTVGEGLTGILNIGGFAMTITGSTTITSGGTINVTSATGTPKFFTGDFTNNGTWNNSGNSTITFTGDITNNGTFTAGSGAYSLSGLSKNINSTNASGLTIPSITWLGSYTISSGFTVAKPFASTTIAMSNAASSLTNNGVVTVATSLTTSNAAALVSNAGTLTVPTLTITSGTVTNTGTVTVSTAIGGSGTFNNNNGATLTYGGSGAIAPTLNASTNANLVNYNNGGTQTVKGTTYHNLTISGSGTKTLGAATTVNKDLIVSGTATLADGAFAITGNASGTFQLGSGTGYTTTRTATSWFPTATPLANYTIDNNSTVTFGATATLNNSIPATYGHLVFGTGARTLPASYPIQVNGNLTLSGNIDDNGNTITVKGNIASTGFHSGAGKVLLSGGAAAHNVQGTGWNNVELNDAQGATLTAAFTIGTQTTGAFALTSGVVSMNNFNFTISNVNAAGFTGGTFSASTMVLQNGTGNFIRQITNSTFPTTYLFPIGESTGTTEYSPVSVTINSNTTIGNMAFRVVDAQHPNDLSTTDYASRYWTVVSAPATFTYTASFGYTTPDRVGTENTYDVFEYDGTNWQYIPATAASNVVTYDGTASTFAANDAFVVKAPLSIPATVTIDGAGGSAGVYANLTGTTGLFAALNQAVISSNITVNVTATPIAETGAIALNQVTETGAGAGTYTITIQSNNSTPKVFDGTYNGAAIASNGIIRLNGADRVTFNGGTGTNRRLLFRNTNTGSFASVFHFLNDASNNKINNCTIEGSIAGNVTSAIQGLIYVGAGVTTGNDNIVITNNDIKQAGSTTPSNGVATDGTSATVQNNLGEISNNNIYNIHRGTVDNAAIHIAGNSPGWTISANRIYQESARTSVTSTIYGIYFSTTTSDGASVTNNVIGYAASDGTGTTSFNTTALNGAARFEGIYVNGSASLNTITGNTIDNISLTTTSGGSATIPPFAGIFINGGKYLVDGNYIGSTSGAPSVVVTSSTSISAANAVAAIFANSTASGQTISNNHIGGMSLALSSGTLAMNLNGIKVATGSVTVDGNEIGNATANSFLMANPGTGSAFNYGIWAGSGAAYTLNITNNVIKNLATTNVGVNTTSQVAGINATSAANYFIDGNNISGLTSNSQSTSATVPSVVGITATPGSTLAHSVSGNTIYALSNTSAANTVVTGIYFTGGSGISQVNKNFIYNLRSGSGATSIINGIHIGASQITVSNNRVRLGYDETGAAISNTSVITGILKENITVNNSFYYNSVYIGGTGVAATANNTYAFRRLVTGGTDNFRNNIFVNARSNASGGGKHYALYLNNTTTITEDYNLMYAPGSGGVMASVNGTDQTTMTAWKAANSGLDVNSVSGDPQFEDPTNSTAPNLKLKTSVATPAESGAVAITGLTDDFEATNVRTGYPLGLPQGGTAPDMGADEANLLPKDLLPPVITLTPISTISTACGANQTITVTATVTDAFSGVATGSLAPTMWWRLSTGTYAALLPSSVSGSTYTYTLNLTGVAGGQTYHYYIAAQDAASPANIGYSSGAPVHADVSATPSPINASPSSVTVTSTTPLSGTVMVGTGGTYTTFNGASGLFAAINTNGLSGNLTVNVISNITETVTTGLNQVPYYCGGPYTITIQSSTATLRTITAALTTALIQFNGADNIVVEGKSGGAGRYLKFVNTNTATGMAFQFLNDASNITIQNCDIIGMGSTTNAAVVSIGTGTTTGNNNITLNSNLLHDNGTGTYPLNLIYSSGITGAANNTINITNNEIYNFSCFSGGNGRRAYGINVTATGNGSNWTITGNSIYSTFIDASGLQTCINFIPGSSSNSNVINGNYIGGRAALCAGLAMDNNYSGDFIGIAIDAGNGTGTTIQGNTIQNMLADYGDGSGVTAINVAGSTRVNITGNTIGHPTLVNSLQSDGGSTSLSVASGWVYAVYSVTSSPITITNNTMAGLASVGIYNSYVNIIEHAGTGTATITGNYLGRTYSSGSASGYNTKGIVVTSNASGHVISNNVLEYIGNGSSGAISGPTADGIQVSSTGGSGTIANNKVNGLFNASNGGYSVGLWIIGTGSWNVTNNMLSLSNTNWLGTYTTRKEYYGILDYSTGGSNKYYYNTVLVQGSQTGTAGFDYPSECFYKLPGGTGSGNGGVTELKNNILINSRTGNPTANSKHYAIDNSSTTPSTNWTSDYNFISTANTATLGFWTPAGDVTFAQWKTNTGGDANSTNAQATSGSSSATTVNPAELFVNAANGDLHILTTPTTAPYPYFFVSNVGVTVATTTDYDAATRTSTPDIGADEFFACTTPVVSGNTPTNPTCAGNDGAIALAGLAASTSFTLTYDKNSTPVASASYTSNGSGVITISGLGNGNYNNFVVTAGPGCSSAAYPASGSVTLTNPVTPVVTGHTPTNPTCASGDGTIALTGLANSTTYSVTYNKNGTPVSAANFTSNGSGIVTVGSLTNGNYNNFVLTPVGGCASTAYPSSGNITLTNPVTPVVTGHTPTNPTCASGDGTIALAGLANTTTYSVTYNKNGAPVTAANFTSNGSGIVTVGSLTNGNYNNFVLTPVGGCASVAYPSSGSVTLTNPVTPVVTGHTPTNPTCASGDGTIALTGLANSTTYSVTYNKNGTPVAAANFTSNGSGVVTIGSLTNGAYNNFVLTPVGGCASVAYPSSGSVTLTNPVTPAVSSNTPTQPTCLGGGTDGSIALSGLANGTVYSVTYSKNGTPVAAANFTSNGSGVVTIGSLTNGAYTNFILTPVGGCASVAYPSSGSISLTAPVCGTNTWQGDVVGNATDWFDAGNWTNNVVPNSCSADAIIPSSPSGGNNFPILTASASVGNITVFDNASITINSGRSLAVCGNWTGGTTTASTVTGAGNVVLTGNAAQTLNGRTAFTTLHVGKTTGTTATMQAGSFFDITTAVELESGTLATGSGTLTFKSTSTTQIAVLDNFSSGFTGNLTGNITAERFYNATGTTNQHYMGSPVSTTLAQFGASGSTSVFVTPKPTCDETALASTSAYGSVFSYDQSNGSSCSLAGWKVEAGSVAATAAKGFAVTKSGAGTLSVSGAPNLATSYSQSGTNSGWSNSSLQGRPMTAGWVLVSNPYLAYLDFTTQGAPTNFTSEVKVWHTTGAFAGTYQDLQAGQMIAPFQGFFVKSTATGSYPINGNKRTRSTAGTFQAQANDQQLSILATNNSTTLADVTMVAFNSDATTGFDNDYDAQKIAGTLGRHTLYTVGANNLWMSKNIHKSIAETSTITMGFEPELAGSYTFSFDGLNSFDPTSYIMLEDRKLGTMYNVRNGDYQFTADTADQWERFVLHFTPAAEITTVNENCSTLGNINVTQPGAANWNYTIADVNNNNAIIATGTLNETTPIGAAVSAGTYSITLVDNNNYTVVKMVTVTGTTPINAAFTSSATTVEEGNDVTFNSTTAAAVTTEWNFGDGNVDNTNYPNPTHTYSTPGTYTVTLTVTNRDGCTSTTTQTVTVTEKTATGLPSMVNGQSSIHIWSNGNLVFIDFSRISKTDATVSIYNILGQELVNERFGRSTIYSKAITNVEASYVIVKVTNGDAITTKKVLIANVK